MIGIVDTGGANHASITNALARLGKESCVSGEVSVLGNCDRLILPGVGHAAHAMDRLRDLNLIDFLKNWSRPILGICLGQQILFESSEEGAAVGLGLLPGRVTRLQASEEFRVPNMGWSRLLRGSRPSLLLEGIPEDAYFYFVHSYVVPDGEWSVASTAPPQPVPSVIEWQNLFAVQFHPERSGIPGSKLLHNFLKFKPAGVS